MKTPLLALVLALSFPSLAYADEEWIFARAGGSVLGYDAGSGSSDLITGAKVVRLDNNESQPKLALQKFQVDCRSGRYQSAGTVAMGDAGAIVFDASNRSEAWEPVESDRAVTAFKGMFCGE